MRIIIAQWVPKAEAKRIRRQYMLHERGDPPKVAYIARVDFGQPCGRRAWIVFGDN